MKKVFKVVSIIIVIVMLATCFSSCAERRQVKELLKMDESARADKLFELAEAATKEVDSYSAETDLSFSGTVSGIKISMTGYGETKISGQTGDNYAYVTTAKLTMKMSGSDVDENTEMESEKGFYGDKMYIYNKDDDGTQKLWSTTTKEAFLADIESGEDDFEFDMAFFSEKSAKQKDDKTWSVKLSGASAEGLEKMAAPFEGIDDMFEETHKLRDVEVDIRYDKKYLPISLEVRYVYEAVSTSVKDAAPVVTIEEKYKDYGETEVEEPDLGGYTETDDLTFIGKVSEAFSDKESFDEKVSFTATYTNVIKDGYTGTEYSRTKYDYNGVAENGADGKFKYTLKVSDSDSSSGKTTYSYSNGKQRIEVGGSLYDSSACSEFVAKEFVREYIDFCDFSSDKVKTVDKKSDTRYEFELSSSKLREEIEAANAKVNSVKAVLSVTLDGENLTGYTYTETVKYTLNGGEYTYIATMQVKFQ